MLKELEVKRKKVETLLNTIIEMTDDLLICNEQKQALEDAKWNVLGSFDAEISYTKNMLPKIELQKQIKLERMMNTFNFN